MSKIKTFIMCLLMAASVQAQPSKEKHVTIIVPFAAGGPVDTMARKLAGPFSRHLGQPVIVENIPSAGGVVGLRTLSQARPDGLTMMANTSALATLPYLNKNSSVDPIVDFAPVGEIADVPMVIVGRSKLQPTGFRQLAKYLADNQQKVTVATAGAGTSSHLCALALLDKLKIQANIVPYRGAGPALIDIQGGHVDVMCTQVTTVIQPIKAGLVKPYAVVYGHQLPDLPGVPTLEEQNFTGFNLTIWNGIWTVKGTPPDIVNNLSRALQQAVEDPEFIKEMSQIGAVPVTRGRATPASLEKRLQSDTIRWKFLSSNQKND